MKIGNLVRFVGCGHLVDVGDLALILEVRDLDWTTMCIVLHQRTGRITTCRNTQLEKVS